MQNNWTKSHCLHVSRCPRMPGAGQNGGNERRLIAGWPWFIQITCIQQDQLIFHTLLDPSLEHWKSVLFACTLRALQNWKGANSSSGCLEQLNFDGQCLTVDWLSTAGNVCPLEVAKCPVHVDLWFECLAAMSAWFFLHQYPFSRFIFLAVTVLHCNLLLQGFRLFAKSQDLWPIIATSMLHFASAFLQWQGHC